MRQACQHCLNAERSSLAATKCVLTTNLHVLSPRPLRYNGYNNNNMTAADLFSIKKLDSGGGSSWGVVIAVVMLMCLGIYVYRSDKARHNLARVLTEVRAR